MADKIPRIPDTFDQFVADNKLLMARKAALIKRHPNQWVVMRRGRIVRAPSFLALMEKLGDDRNHPHAKLDPNPPKLILAIAA